MNHDLNSTAEDGEWPAPVQIDDLRSRDEILSRFTCFSVARSAAVFGTNSVDGEFPPTKPKEADDPQDLTGVRSNLKPATRNAREILPPVQKFEDLLEPKPKSEDPKNPFNARAVLSNLQPEDPKNPFNARAVLSNLQPEDPKNPFNARAVLSNLRDPPPPPN
ncbi:hypothetical protein AAG570_011539 [Ranatra chinensis]|uniref:Uncharacterized protein n=1 Tax=Ranatra chinensis TaxID=642074 RepID=A0ABD0YKY3_9HEMI